MSLVANYSSSESEDSDTETQRPQLQQPVQKKRGLSSLLPPPKKTKTIAVEAPEFEDDEEKERETKRVKSSAGLGLADLLPAPKNYKAPVPVTKTTTDKALMPHSLARKLKGKAKQTEPVEEEKNEIVEEEEEKEEVIEKKEVEKPKKFTGSFFHIGKALKEEPVIKTTPKKVQPTPGPMYTVEKPAAAAAAAATVEEPQYAAVDAFAYDPNAMYSSDPSTYYQYQQYQQQYYEQGDQDNVGNLEGGQDLERIVGKRLRGESNIQIKTISQADMLPSEEWRAAQSLTAAPKFNSGITMAASKMQMKKNNITALVAHAVNNQEKLDEMFAANKKTRREASKKYGF